MCCQLSFHPPTGNFAVALQKIGHFTGSGLGSYLVILYHLPSHELNSNNSLVLAAYGEFLQSQGEAPVHWRRASSPEEVLKEADVV